MATNSKMFVHYSGTKAAFISAGLPSQYTNKIVFIKGGENGTGACVYTHGNYYANVEEALSALKYFSKISAGGVVAESAAPNGTINFTADDPAAVSVKVDSTGVHFGLTDDFKTAVNTTLPNRIKAVEDDYLKGADKTEAINAGKVSIGEAAGTGDILKTYTFTQNGETIGTINLARDLVVNGGQVVEKDGVKYLQLAIANQEDPVEIPVSDLVDVYTGSTYINITNGNVIELKLADLEVELVKESSQVGAKIKANADAAAAADAKGAQGIADAAAEKTRAEGIEQGLRADLGESTAAAGTGSAFARIKSLEAEIENLSGGAGSISSQIDEKISAYHDEEIQPIIAAVSEISSDYLTSEDKAEIVGDISDDASKLTLNGLKKDYSDKIVDMQEVAISEAAKDAANKVAAAKEELQGEINLKVSQADYDEEIQLINAAVSKISSDYLTSEDKAEIVGDISDDASKLTLNGLKKDYSDKIVDMQEVAISEAAKDAANKVAAAKEELQGEINLKVSQADYDAKIAELEGFWAWEEL